MYLLALVGILISEVVAPSIFCADDIVLHIQRRGMTFDLRDGHIGGILRAPGLYEELHHLPQVAIVHGAPWLVGSEFGVLDDLGQSAHNVEAVSGNLKLQGNAQCHDDAHQLCARGGAQWSRHRSIST